MNHKLINIFFGLSLSALLVSCDGGGGSDGDSSTGQNDDRLDDTAITLDSLLPEEQIDYLPGLKYLTTDGEPPKPVVKLLTRITISTPNTTSLTNGNVYVYEKLSDNEFILSATSDNGINPTPQQRLADAVEFLRSSATSAGSTFNTLIRKDTSYVYTPADIELMSRLLNAAGADTAGEELLEIPTGPEDFFATDGQLVFHEITSTKRGIIENQTISGLYSNLKLRRKITFEDVSDTFGQGVNIKIPVITDQEQALDASAGNTLSDSRGDFEIRLTNQRASDPSGNDDADFLDADFLDGADDDSVAP
jgi:hypothetical protein